MRWKNLKAFWQDVWAVLRKRLQHHWNNKLKDLFYGALVAAFSFYFAYSTGNETQELEERILALKVSAWVALAWLGFELVTFPYRLWKHQQDKLELQSATIKRFEEKTQPIIDMHFGDTSQFRRTVRLALGRVAQAPLLSITNGVTAEVIRVLPKLRNGIAYSCRGYLTRIEKIIDGERIPQDIGSALQLTWASTNSVEPITLNQSRKEYLNVLLGCARYYGMVICTNHEEAWRWHDNDNCKGTYRLQIHVEQDGIPSHPIYLIVDWNGNWADTRVISEA